MRSPGNSPMHPMRSWPTIVGRGRCGHTQGPHSIGACVGHRRPSSIRCPYLAQPVVVLTGGGGRSGFGNVADGSFSWAANPAFTRGVKWGVNMDDSKPPSLWLLLKWPIDVCTFGLAFAYGVRQILATATQADTIDPFVLTTAYAVTCLVSCYVACRYMPSTRIVEHVASWVLGDAWVWLTIGLSVGVPAVAIFWGHTTSFWLMIVGAASLKAVYTLESARREGVVSREESAESEPHPGLTGLDRMIFKEKPDAYALQPGITALLFTTAAVSQAIIYQTIHDVESYYIINSVMWLVGGLAIGTYIQLSTSSRVRAIRRSARK